MRLKHFVGYGIVNAQATQVVETMEGMVVLTINVWGDHEMGLECDDKYTISKWLLKNEFDYRKIVNVEYEAIDDILNQEAIQYKITINVK